MSNSEVMPDCSCQLMTRRPVVFSYEVHVLCHYEALVGSCVRREALL